MRADSVGGGRGTPKAVQLKSFVRFLIDQRLIKHKPQTLANFVAPYGFFIS